MVEQRVQSMRTTVAEIQRCKPGLCLPGNTEETLTVFTVVNQLQNLLLDLEKVRPSVWKLYFFLLLSLDEGFSDLLDLFVESPSPVHPAASEPGPVQSSEGFFSSNPRIFPGGH